MKAKYDSYKMSAVWAVVVAVFVGLSSSTVARAQTCSSYAYTTFQKGDPVHASQLMNNYYQIANCVNYAVAGRSNPIFSGNVGIGISPSYPLDVNGNARVSGGIFTQAIQILPSNPYLGDDDGGIFIDAGSAAEYEFKYYGEFVLDNNGIYANGEVQAPGYYAYSDERLKKNITPLANGLSMIQSLNPVRYQWRGAKERTFAANLNLTGGEAHIGFIAQQVAPVIPEAVVSPKDDASPYEIKPLELIAVLVETIKEQQAELTQLKAQLASLP